MHQFAWVMGHFIEILTVSTFFKRENSTPPVVWLNFNEHCLAKI
jgi:hypothetical protein